MSQALADEIENKGQEMKKSKGDGGNRHTFTLKAMSTWDNDSAPEKKQNQETG